MNKESGYLVFDIGTGNVRVAIVTTSGEVVSIEREDIHYLTETLYPDSRYFLPDTLWEQVIRLAKKVIKNSPTVTIKGITSTSQRQGIVLLDKSGNSFIGLPNIDNRGREWEQDYLERDLIYKTTGRLPSALFSALKLVGLKKRQPALWDRIASFTSISDWITYKLSDVLVYEPSQATETLLYNVREQTWSKEMCEQFDIPFHFLPELKWSGSILGHIIPSLAEELEVNKDVSIIVGGGDSQLAIESTFAKTNDMIIISGTTTPICKMIDEYKGDEEKRAWTNAHTHKNRWLVETNPGITGLNYQKLKNLFYPNESYQQMEYEISQLDLVECVAALGIYLSDEKNASKKGGFIFNAPLAQDLSRAHFVAAALWEIACTIRLHFDQILEVTPFDLPYVWGCGGGFQSEQLAQFIANLLQKELRIPNGFSQASVVGAAVICNQALGQENLISKDYKTIKPDKNHQDNRYSEWLRTQHFFSEMNSTLN
ncbi:FGGY-family carbohydrate kinase [Metabacillus schmidteae]|uniref:FGGY-family carbohydrate kinase n=1 Tax=Metabacillus schmidteae TaxID=2730405 RepID=UPI0015883F86|nr:FGGY family carbohydrate kinase [Metabacillus schmidteae]